MTALDLPRRDRALDSLERHMVGALAAVRELRAAGARVEIRELRVAGALTVVRGLKRYARRERENAP